MRSVIIVDNDVWSAEKIRRNFNSMGKPYRIVEVFGNGKEALQFLEENPTKADFLIADICMPGFPGLELFEKIRKINNHLQCIIMSAQQVFEYAVKAMELGVVRYLLKPIETEKLSGVLDSLIFKTIDTRGDEQNLNISREVKFMKKEIDIGFRNVDMNRIAEELGYSKEYLYRIFRKEMNISVNNYLQNVRLEKAKEYMSENGKYKVYEVCEMVGYEDQVYFSKLFKKKYSVSPKDFQKYDGEKYNEVQDITMIPDNNFYMC